MAGHSPHWKDLGAGGFFVAAETTFDGFFSIVSMDESLERGSGRSC